MTVILSPKAEKQLRKLTKIDQMAVAGKIRSIRDNLGAAKSEKLTGFKNIYRVRVGSYRLVCRQSSNKIYIILISHRKDVYRLLQQLI